MQNLVQITNLLDMMQLNPQCYRHVQDDQISTSSSTISCENEPQKYKTELCKYYILGKKCPFSFNCLFAHQSEELRERNDQPNNYKTKSCQNYLNKGFCKYGSRCQFLHLIGQQQSLPHLKYTNMLNYIDFIDQEINMHANFQKSQILEQISKKQ